MSVTTNGFDCNGGLDFFSVNVSYQYYIPNLKIVSFDIFCRIYFVLSVFLEKKNQFLVLHCLLVIHWWFALEEEISILARNNIAEGSTFVAGCGVSRYFCNNSKLFSQNYSICLGVNDGPLSDNWFSGLPDLKRSIRSTATVSQFSKGLCVIAIVPSFFVCKQCTVETVVNKFCYFLLERYRSCSSKPLLSGWLPRWARSIAVCCKLSGKIMRSPILG